MVRPWFSGSLGWLSLSVFSCRRVRRCWRLSAADQRRALRHMPADSTSSGVRVPLCGLLLRRPQSLVFYQFPAFLENVMKLFKVTGTDRAVSGGPERGRASRERRRAKKTKWCVVVSLRQSSVFFSRQGEDRTKSDR